MRATMQINPGSGAIVRIVPSPSEQARTKRRTARTLELAGETPNQANRAEAKNDSEVTHYLFAALGIVTQLAIVVGSSNDAIESACRDLLHTLNLTASACAPGQIGRSGIHDVIQDNNTEGALTAREQHILQWISRGLSNKEIAKVLGIGPETVKTHVSHIFLKLEVKKRAEATTLAHSRGLLKHQVSLAGELA